MLRFGVRGLLQEYDSSEDIVHDDDCWTELDIHDWKDWVHIALTGLYQLVVFMVVFHLWRQRSWPPYCPRQICLVCMTGLTGIVAYLGALITAGTMRRRAGDIFAHCGLDALFVYATWGVWISVALVRVYRSWKILIKHSVDMWPACAQVLLLTTPWCIPAVVYTIDKDMAPFNETRNWCEVYQPVDTFAYSLGSLLIVGAFVLVYQMRKVRKQMNEYHLQVFQLAFLLVTGSVIYPLQHAILDDRHDIRRTWVLYNNLFDSLVLFWPPIAEPMYRYLTGDAEYLNSYTQGFSTLPTPAQMKSSFRDQLALEELRTEFEKFAEERQARELPDFYKACLERDEVEDYFGRQAATSAIIDRFVRVGSEQEVNLGHHVREKILQTEITSFNIFSEAMSVVVLMMDTNFSAAFKRSEAYKLLEKDVQEEAEELARLKKMKQLPSQDHVPLEAGGLLKLTRRLFRLPLSKPEYPQPCSSLASGSSADAGEIEAWIAPSHRRNCTVGAVRETKAWVLPSHRRNNTEGTTSSGVEMMGTSSFPWASNGGASASGDPCMGQESKEDRTAVLDLRLMRNSDSTRPGSSEEGACSNV
ncbi:unnamed protein product [Ectocarpus fasciculatus]